MENLNVRMWYYGSFSDHGTICAELVSENRAIVTAIAIGHRQTMQGSETIWKELGEHDQWIIDLQTGKRVETLE